VGAVPAVPARVRSCSVGADPVIPGLQLLRVGRSSHLSVSSVRCEEPDPGTSWTMARRICVAHGAGVLRECRRPARFRSNGFILSAPSTDASHSRFVVNVTSTMSIRIIRRCGQACLRADGFAPRVLAARAAAVALVENAPETTPEELLRMSLQQTCPPLELDAGESLRDSSPSTQASRGGWLMQSNSAGVSKPTHILTTNCLLGPRTPRMRKQRRVEPVGALCFCCCFPVGLRLLGGCRSGCSSSGRQLLCGCRSSHTGAVIAPWGLFQPTHICQTSCRTRDNWTVGLPHFACEPHRRAVRSK